MMSSSPDHNPILDAVPVHAFQYQEADSLDGTVGDLGQPAVVSQVRVSTHGPSTPEELEQYKAEARGEGMREGLLQAQKKFEQELVGERAKIEETIRNFRSQAGQYYARAEVELVQLSLAIAAKILHREAQVDPTLVAALVRITLEKLQHGTNVTVCVRPEEVAEWNKYFELHKEDQSRVQVKADPALQPHDCILETELGVTDVGLSSQLKEIEKGFFDLLAQRPDTK
jgi:flagellar assembly protein FliH